MYQGVQTITEIFDLHKAQLQGEINASAHQENDDQRQFTDNGELGVPFYIGGEPPDQIGKILEDSTYTAG